MIASEEKAGKGRQTKRIVENKSIRGGEETGERREKKGRRRSRRKMVRERRTGEGMRGQKCVGGKRREEGLTAEYRSFPKRSCVPQPDN